MQGIRGWLFGGAAAIALGCVFVVVTRQARLALIAPRLVVSQEVLEFSELSPGQDEVANVRLENRGRSILNIHAVKVTCGCTSVSLPSNELAAGSSTSLKVIATGKGLGASRLSNVMIISNDPAQPLKLIRVIVRPTKQVGFEPSEIDFGRIERSRLAATQMVTVRLESGVSLSAADTLIDSSLPFVTSEIVSRDIAGNSISAFVTLDSTAPTGEFVGRLRIRLAGSDREHSASVIGCVVGEFFADPPAIVLGPVRRNDGSTRHAIHVRARDERAFTVVGAVGPPEWRDQGLSVSVVTADGASKIQVACDPEKWSQPWSGQRLKSDVRISLLKQDGKTSDLNVPVELILEN